MFNDSLLRGFVRCRRLEFTDDQIDARSSDRSVEIRISLKTTDGSLLFMHGMPADGAGRLMLVVPEPTTTILAVSYTWARTREIVSDTSAPSCASTAATTVGLGFPGDDIGRILES